MRAHYTFSRSIKIAVLGSWLFGGASLLTAVPVLEFEQVPEGLKISWDATEGRDWVPEASSDLETWTDLELSITQPMAAGRNQVLVPTNQVQQYYRLRWDDGVTTRAAYVGATKCGQCHPGNHAEWIESGHPYKLNKVEGGVPPTYFSAGDMNVPLTPPKDPAHPELDVDWSDVAWVIGGAIWKARFIDHDGYIITGEEVQFNLGADPGAADEWTAYHTENPRGTKPYNCGACHTTGWVSTDDGSVHQDAQPGMWGSFAATGIECEACHGPGSRHVTDGLTREERKAEITLDTSAALCGSCHVRGSIDTIPASNGFIRHHEQYNEMLSAGHAGHDCVTCHDPHKSVKIGARDGIKDTAGCTDCHNFVNPADGTIPWNFAGNFHGEDGYADCIDCHMPRASKSAIKQPGNDHNGDIKTHIFKINPAADGVMFTPDGKFVQLDGSNQSAGVTLDFVCYKCHDDPLSATGGGPEFGMTMPQLESWADNYHGLPVGP